MNYGLQTVIVKQKSESMELNHKFDEVQKSDEVFADLVSEENDGIGTEKGYLW